MIAQQRTTAQSNRHCVRDDSHGAPVALVVTAVPGRQDVATWWCQECMDRLDVFACEALMPSGSSVSVRSWGPGSFRLAAVVGA